MYDRQVRAVVAVIVLLATVGVADAGAWYYTWSCAGACAPNQLAIRGVSGPFASEEMCNDARWGDSRRHEFIGPGNLGGLSSCLEYDSAPSADDVGVRGTTSKVPRQRYSLGLVGGAPWHVTDGTTDTAGERTLGVDLQLVAGARPLFAVELGLGVHRAPIRSPGWMAGQTMYVIPLTIGLTSSPGLVRARKLELRLDLGADMGFLFRRGCAACTTDGVEEISFVYVLRAGLDTYFGAYRRMGIGISGLFMFGKQGDRADALTPSAIEIEPPTFLIRVALLRRNGQLFW